MKRNRWRRQPLRLSSLAEWDAEVEVAEIDEEAAAPAQKDDKPQRKKKKNRKKKAGGLGGFLTVLAVLGGVWVVGIGLALSASWPTC